MRINKIICLAVIFFLTGCTGTPRFGGGYHKAEKRSQPNKKSSATHTAIDPIAMGQIIDTYLGKPYSGKGTSQKGYDCSEFVGAVFNEYASIHLPRTTEKMYKSGRWVERGDLFFGDLVFFDTGGKGVSHLGIYIGFDEFVHSSTSNGIIISSLNERYYKRRYLGARRVLE